MDWIKYGLCCTLKNTNRWIEALLQEEQISASFLYRCAVETLEEEDRGIRNTRKIDSTATPMLGKKEGREEEEINVR